MEEMNNEPKQIITPEKAYKTPAYTRKAVKNYSEKKKTEDPELYKQKRKESNKKYYEKQKNKNQDNKID